MRILIISSFFIDPTKGGVQRVSSLLFEAFMRKGMDVYFLVLDGGEWVDRRNVDVKTASNNSTDHHDYFGIEMVSRVSGNNDSHIQDASLTDRILERTYFLPERESFPRKENIEFSVELIKRLGITHCINQTDLFARVVEWKVGVELELRKPIWMASVHHNCVGCLATNYRELRFGGRVNLDRVNGKVGWSREEVLFRLMDRKWVWRLMTILVRKKYRNLFGGVIEGSDRYVLLSESFRKELIDFGVSGVEKLVSIPNPSTYSTVQIGEELLKFHSELIESKENRVLFVGRLDHGQKRPDKMIRIFERLHSQFADWQFDVVGDGNAMNELKDYAMSRGLDRVYFHGFQDPKQFYLRSKIFVMTSDYEGFGLTLVEAQSFGVVPVVNRCFSSVEDVVPKTSGIVVDFGKDVDFVESAANLMENEDLWKRLSQGGIDHSRNFDADVIAEKWVELFNSAVGV
jgi:glycosyltransferase involved in cell wall biosynthesis